MLTRRVRVCIGCPPARSWCLAPGTSSSPNVTAGVSRGKRCVNTATTLNQPLSCVGTGGTAGIRPGHRPLGHVPAYSTATARGPRLVWALHRLVVLELAPQAARAGLHVNAVGNGHVLQRGAHGLVQGGLVGMGAPGRLAGH